MNEITIILPGTEYQTLDMKVGNASITVESKDRDGDVEIRVARAHNLQIIYLNQEQVKALINHLQSQIVK
jgi:DUF4097 and DUF4098 domain-containing protein YvlB